MNLIGTPAITVFAEGSGNLNIEFMAIIDGVEHSVNEINLRPGERIDVTAKITPETAEETVRWSQTAVSGFNLVKNGNTVTIKIADDMPVGQTYELIASCGNFSKLLTINIVGDHIHSYSSETTKEATCVETGIITYACTCGDSYTEEISAKGHTYTEGNYTIDVEATRETNGSKSIHCNVCNAIIEGTSVEIEYVEEIICTHENKYVKDGYYYCSDCDEQLEEYINPDVTEKVTVTFDPNCDSLECEVITIDKGDEITKDTPSTISRSDAVFDGWYDASGNPLTTAVITEDTTYFAKWKEIKNTDDDSKNDTDNSSGDNSKNDTDNSSGDNSKNDTDNSSGDNSKNDTDNSSGSNLKDNTDNSSGSNLKDNTDNSSGSNLKDNTDNSSDNNSKNDTNNSSSSNLKDNTDNSSGDDLKNDTDNSSGSNAVSRSSNSSGSISSTTSKTSSSSTVKKRSFLISFNCTGGTTENHEYANIDNNTSCGFYVEEGMSLGKLPVPTRKGYIFDGWYDIRNNKIDETTIPVRNTTYYAKWIKE